ncbi:LuxR C-terminal-related transcriptional regulator [Scandinavium sp.]|uniref:LuxR C-terminal-related transcriptional regulator n=1 Tax=Scandinavium sp. TaxID=2830653 RepID=UPI0028964E4A|nr:LuxR C-terminal-related transcriptional regulator [Scandinavium sp.]
MKIISDDVFFTYGMDHLTHYFRPATGDEITVFDSGHQHVYFFNATQMRKNKINDPFSALVYCRNLNVPRDASVAITLQHLKKSNGIAGTVTPLTEREERILRSLCQETSVTSLLKCYGISSKTFSTHKRNGLRKLGIKNTVMLYSLLEAWKGKWGIIFPEYGRQSLQRRQRRRMSVLPGV